MLVLTHARTVSLLVALVRVPPSVWIAVEDFHIMTVAVLLVAQVEPLKRDPTIVKPALVVAQIVAQAHSVYIALWETTSTTGFVTHSDASLDIAAYQLTQPPFNTFSINRLLTCIYIISQIYIFFYDLKPSC